jgi:hypothetical protein
MSTNEPQALRDEYFWNTEILLDDYKPEILDDVIKTCENLHVEKQYQLKIVPDIHGGVTFTYYYGLSSKK